MQDTDTVEIDAIIGGWKEDSVGWRAAQVGWLGAFGGIVRTSIDSS